MSTPSLFRRLLDSVDRFQDRRARARVHARGDTRFLIVDDSATVVALLRRMLRQNHFQTYEAGDAEQGVELARAHKPDLIFLDIVLPGMSGFEALRRLRRDAATRDIPVIMISGNVQATEQFYLQRIGADDFMKKPFSRAEVFSRIERLLGEDRVPRRLGTASPAADPESEVADESSAAA